MAPLKLGVFSSIKSTDLVAYFRKQALIAEGHHENEGASQMIKKNNLNF